MSARKTESAPGAGEIVPPAESREEGGETVFALSSGAGRAALAVVRVSGPAAGAVLEALTGRPLPPPRAAQLSRFFDPQSGALLDRGLALWFPGPASATGEDLAELHLHGGPAVVAGVLEALGGRRDLRPAEPGEFTRRAFDAGKLDLSAVEGLADLIAAETAAQRRQALNQMEGALARRVSAWRDRLVSLLAHLEADIDFVDEEDVQVAPADVLREALDGLAEDIEAALADRGRGERLREGYAVAILGAPNAGKSTLLNALARREVAIVSETPGTTRDVLEVHLDLGGLPVTLADTAGLRELDGEAEGQAGIEAEGIRRARARAEAADLRLLLTDLSEPLSLGQGLADLLRPGDLLIGSKADLVGAGDPELRLEALREAAGLALSGLVLSGMTGEGLAALEAALQDRAAAGLGAAAEPSIVTRARQRSALEDCARALRRALRHGAAELIGEELRLALRALGRVTGQVDVEDLLDVIFRDFCIGK